MKNKTILIRLNEDDKVDFRVAMLRQRVSMQNLLQSFVDSFIAFDKGAKSLLMEKIIEKAQKTKRTLTFNSSRR
jgi:hypothetical protein